MRVIESDLVCAVDVDDTLVSWDYYPKQPHPECVSKSIKFNGKSKMYWIYPPNIQSLITHVHKGHAVVVWSGSGWRWTKAVVEALGIQSYVDTVMCKPRWLLDDCLPENFLPRPYWGAGDPGKNKLK